MKPALFPIALILFFHHRHCACNDVMQPLERPAIITLSALIFIVAGWMVAALVRRSEHQLCSLWEGLHWWHTHSNQTAFRVAAICTYASAALCLGLIGIKTTSFMAGSLADNNFAGVADYVRIFFVELAAAQCISLSLHMTLRIRRAYLRIQSNKSIC